MTIRGWGRVLRYFRYFHIYLGSEHYFCFKTSEKYHFWEYKDLWIFFLGEGGGGGGGITKSDYVNFFFGGGGGAFLYILGLFKVLRSRYRMGIFFGYACMLGGGGG